MASQNSPRAQKDNIVMYLFLSSLAVAFVIIVFAISRYVVDKETSPIIRELEAQVIEDAVDKSLEDNPVFDPCALTQVWCEGEPALTVTDKITFAAYKAGLDPAIPLRIATCESGLDPYASNPNSTAKGLFQFTDPTWRYINASSHQFNADESIKQFMIWYPIHPEWWECK